MQKGRVFSLKRFGLLEVLNKNAFLLTILLFLVVGIILGVFLFDDISKITDYADDFITEFVDLRTNNAFLKIFSSSFFSSIMFLFLFFVLGASIFGIVTIPIALTAKGFLQGAVSAYLYSEYGLKGIAFNAVIYIPSTIIFIIILLLASKESISFSLKISSLTIPKTLPLNLAYDFKNYSIKYLLFVLATVFSAVVDAMLSLGLMKYFSL